MIRRILLLSILLSSFSSLAMTDSEVKDFKAKVSKMSNAKKSLLITGNTLSLLGMCSLSTVRTVVTAVADTLPLTTGLSKAITRLAYEDEIYYDTFARETLGEEILTNIGGGAISGVVDLVMAGDDSLDGSIDKINPFENILAAYKSTRIVAIKTFGKSSICFSNIQRIGILSGADK